MSTVDSGLVKWAEDWAKIYEQSWKEHELTALVGKKVRGHRPPVEEDEEARGFTAQIVGYSIDRIFIGDEKVFRHSLITDEGHGVPLFRGMSVYVEEPAE